MVFVFQKTGKFWSISLDHFIKHKGLTSEEWHHNLCSPILILFPLWTLLLLDLLEIPTYPHHLFMCRVHLTFISTRYIIWFRLVDLPNIFNIFVCHVTPNQILTIVSITGCNSSGLQFFFWLWMQKHLVFALYFFLSIN